MSEANWADASLQEVFNHVAEHLLSQGEKAINNLGTCELYGVNGYRCAYGCLLPVEYYKNNSESTWWPAVKATGIDDDYDREFLMESLMDCHDEYHPIYWREYLLGIARHYKLEIPGFLLTDEGGE